MKNSKLARADLIRKWPPVDLTTHKTYLPRDTYGNLYAVYSDVVLAQSWTDVKIHTLGNELCPVISGKRPSGPPDTRFVWPTRAEHSTSIHRLDTLFKCVHSRLDTNMKKLYLGIVHTDSTVVYYTLNEGLVKPTVN